MQINRNDSYDDENEDEDMIIPYLFKSSLDVGSHFIDVTPENELVFINNHGTLQT